LSLKNERITSGPRRRRSFNSLGSHRNLENESHHVRNQPPPLPTRERLMNQIAWERVEPGRFVAKVNGSMCQVLRSPERGPDRGFISVVDKKVLPTISTSWSAAKTKAINHVERKGRKGRGRELYTWETSMIEKAAKELGLETDLRPVEPEPPSIPEPLPDPAAEFEARRQRIEERVRKGKPEPEPVQVEPLEPETFDDPLGFHPFEEVEQAALELRSPDLEPPADVQECRVELRATILSSDTAATIEAVRAAAGLLRELGVVVCTIDLPPRISV
jgi:hypothetical protein